MLREYSYSHRGFWVRLAEAIIDRISGRYRLREIEVQDDCKKSSHVDVEKLDNHSRR
jgi:hypothetical protein